MESKTAIPLWRSRNGDLPIKELSEEHLQKAYNSAEYRFMKYENLAVNSAEKAALFEEKLKELEAEAYNRHIPLQSIAAKDAQKFGILRNRKRVRAME